MNAADPRDKSSVCPRCGSAFVCGMVAGHAICWCAALPPTIAVPTAPGAGCYCPACLREVVAAQAGER